MVWGSDKDNGTISWDVKRTSRSYLSEEDVYDVCPESESEVVGDRVIKERIKSRRWKERHDGGREDKA